MSFYWSLEACDWVVRCAPSPNRQHQAGKVADDSARLLFLHSLQMESLTSSLRMFLARARLAFCAAKGFESSGLPISDCSHLSRLSSASK